MGATAWKRMMDYCDGNEPYSGHAYSDVPLEHLRTDIIAHNDARLAELTTLRARIGDAEAEVERWHATTRSARTRIAELDAALASANDCIRRNGFGRADARIAELEREKGELAEDARRWRLQQSVIAEHEANHERYARERGED